MFKEVASGRAISELAFEANKISERMKAAARTAPRQRYPAGSPPGRYEDDRSSGQQWSAPPGNGQNRGVETRRACPRGIEANLSMHFGVGFEQD